jgi:hypothetical protein
MPALVVRLISGPSRSHLVPSRSMPDIGVSLGNRRRTYASTGSQGRLCHIIDDADESGSMARTIPGTIHIRQQESEQADECGNKM